MRRVVSHLITRRVPGHLARPDGWPGRVRTRVSRFNSGTGHGIRRGRLTSGKRRATDRLTRWCRGVIRGVVPADRTGHVRGSLPRPIAKDRRWHRAGPLEAGPDASGREVRPSAMVKGTARRDPPPGHGEYGELGACPGDPERLSTAAKVGRRHRPAQQEDPGSNPGVARSLLGLRCCARVASAVPGTASLHRVATPRSADAVPGQ